MVHTYLSAKSFMKTLGFRRHHKSEYLMTFSLHLKKLFFMQAIPGVLTARIECAALLIEDALIMS